MRIHVPTGSTYRTCAVKHHPTDGTRLYAYGSAAVWYSHDSGATWNCAKNYTGAAIYTNKCFGFAPNDGNTWGAGIADYYGVLVTHDNANSFILGGYNDYKNSWLKDPDIVPAMSTAKYSMNIAFSPLNSNILIAGFGSMNQAKFARSTDGGQTFSLIDKKQPTNKNYWIRWNKRDPKKVYLGSLYSDDGGATLKPIDESGLTGSNYQFCGMDGSDNNKVWASAFSNKRYVAYSSDGGLTWANSFDLGWSTGYVAGDLEVFEIFDKNNVYSMCGSYFKSYHRDLVYSIKQPSLKWQKNDWVAANVKDASGDYNSFGNCIQSMAIDPRNKNIIYVVLRTNGIDKIWRSANHGVTWDSIQKNLSRARISGITVKPDTGEVLIGGQMGFWVYPAYGSSISDDNPLWKKWGNSGKPDA
jgi:hypothetical protein